MSQRIFSLPFLVMASPQILPVNLPSAVFYFDTVSIVGAEEAASFFTATVGMPELMRAILQFRALSCAAEALQGMAWRGCG